MKRCLFLLIALIIVAAGCGTKATSQTQPLAESQPSPERIRGAEFPEPVSIPFIDGDSLSYGDYHAVKFKKKVRYEYGDDAKMAPSLLDASYAVLRKNGKLVAKFDGVYGGFGNGTDLGLFSFLGGDAKQLAVSLTLPRGGRHWVVDLTDARIVFDSGKWDVGREGFYVVDVNGDGVYEISMSLTTFYMFENMSIAETPLPEIVFRYDEQAREYVPANPDFQNYILRGIDDAIDRMNADDGSSYISKRLDIVLRYIYAGEEKDAWDFFDKEYKVENKDEIKARIKAELEKERIYKYLYKKSK